MPVARVEAPRATREGAVTAVSTRIFARGSNRNGKYDRCGSVVPACQGYISRLVVATEEDVVAM